MIYHIQLMFTNIRMENAHGHYLQTFGSATIADKRLKSEEDIIVITINLRKSIC